MLDQHNKELNSLEKFYKDRFFNEREKYVELFDLEPKYKAELQKNKDKQDSIDFMRGEINIMLNKMAKYAKKEFGRYPQTLLNDGRIDFDVWTLTREARTAEE